MFDFVKSKLKGKGSQQQQPQAQQEQAAAQAATSNTTNNRKSGNLSAGSGPQIQTSTTMRQRQSTQSNASGASRSSDPDVTYSTTLETDDVNKYDVTQVLTFVLDHERAEKAYYETSFDIMGSEEHWELDDRLIDYDMLSAQPEDADRIYEELKKRALAQKKKEKAHAEVDLLLEIEEMETEEDSDSSVEIPGSARILELIKGYSKVEREDFTNNLITFANKKDKRQIDILLPALKELASDEFSDIKKALLNQFTPLVALITENFGEMGYQSICGTVFPLLDQLLYDEKEDVRDRAIQVVADIRTAVKEDWKEHVMRLALNLAHDEQDKLRESAIKLLNEVSGDMGQQINECFVVNEFRALGLDEQTTVRCTLAQNLTNVSKNISMDAFSQQLFPLYDNLTQDKEWKVRKACADVVAQIAQVTPMDRDAQSLQRLYYRFLLDPSSKIVRGTAFQNIGPFIATLKDSTSIDQRITDFFVNTTMKTNNKDVCYYASFNFPAFIWVTGADEWHKFRALYNKLTSVSDIQTQRTLSCSLHEIARILGPELTDSDLLSIADRFLRHGNPDVRLGVMKNLHVLLAEVPEGKRQQYIQHITQTFNEAGADWRTKEMLAKNLGKYATLFDRQIVYSEFLPMFFKFCEDRIATVSSAAATALASILNKFQEDGDKQKSIIKIVKNNFRDGDKATFKRRQLYILMCQEVMTEAKDLFDQYFKHDFLSLVGDRVVNVRLALARALKSHFRKINCTFMHDKLVNQAVRVLLQDRSQDVIDLVQDIVQFQTDFEESSQSSRNSGMSNDHETALGTFMESLGRSRSSSFSRDSELSDMENEIMQKSGISISKNNEMDSQESERATQPLNRTDTPAPEKKPAADYTASGGQFVSGVEEDLNVAQDEMLVGEDEANEEELERMMQQKFDETLDRRSQGQADADAEAQEQTKTAAEPETAEATAADQDDEAKPAEATSEPAKEEVEAQEEAASESKPEEAEPEAASEAVEEPKAEEASAEAAPVQEDVPEQEDAPEQEEAKAEAEAETAQPESAETQVESTEASAATEEEEKKPEAAAEEAKPAEAEASEDKVDPKKLSKEERKRLIQEKLAAKKKAQQEAAAAENDGQ